MLKKLSGPRIVERRVTIHIAKDGGDETEFSKYRVWLKFELVGRDELKKLQEAFDPADPETDWLKKKILGWRDYMEDDGKTAVDFNPEELTAFLDRAECRIAALEEYHNCVNGGLGKRKN